MTGTKRYVTALIVSVAAFACARGPEAKYKEFAEQVLQRNYDAAAAMTDGLTKDDLERSGSQEHIGAGPPMFQKLFPSQFTIDSKETNADGSVTLHATQLVRFNPAGVESVMRPAMMATLKQVVTLRKTCGDWRVVQFKNTFDKMDSTSAR